MNRFRATPLRGCLAACAAALSACAPTPDPEATGTVSQGLSVSTEIRLDEGSQTTPLATFPVRPHMVAVRDGWAFAAVGFHPMTSSVPYPTHLFRLRPDLTPINAGGTWIDYNQPVRSMGALVTETVDDGAGGAWVLSGQALAHVHADGSADPTVHVPPTLMALARDGADLVAAEQTGASTYISLLIWRLRADGTFATTTPVAQHPVPYEVRDVRIVPAAAGWLIARDQTPSTTGGNTLWYQRIARDGTALDPAPGLPVTAAAADRRDLDVATDGTRWFLTWTAMQGSGSRLAGIYWMMLNGDGTPVGAAVNYVGPGTSSAVGWNGSHFLLAWRDGANARSVRVTPTATVVDATPTTWNVYREGKIAVRASGTEFLVASELGNVWLQRVSAANTLVGPTTLALAYDYQTDSPLVCFDGTNFRARWRAEQRMSISANLWDEERTIRFSPLGARVDATATAVPTLTTPFYGESAYRASVSCRPDAMLSWGHNVTTTTAAGVVTGGVRAFNPALNTPIDSVATPYGFLSVVRRSTGLAALRISPTGDLLDPFPIDVGGARISRLVGDSSGQLGIAVSEFGMSGCDVTITRFTNEGDVLDPGGRTLSWPTPPDHCPLASSSIGVASDGTQHMLTWSYGTLGGACGAMYCRTLYWARISPSGALLDTTPRTFVTGTIRSAPNVTWDGRTWNLIWVDDSPLPHVRLLRLQRNGAPYDTTPQDLGVFSDTTTFVRMSSSTNGTTALTYSRLDERSGSFRGFARVLVNDAPLPDGGTLDAGADAAIVDAASDVRSDTGADVVAVDAGSDVRSDTGADVAIVDAGADVVAVDANSDARSDTGADVVSVVDAGADVAIVDVGTDASAADASADVVVADAGTDVTVADAASDVPSGDVGTDASVADASGDVVVSDAARDASVPDAARDAPMADSGSADSGSADSGVADASVVDAGAPPPADDGGCSASPRSGGRVNGAGLVGAMVMLSVARRRRRRRVR